MARLLLLPLLLLCAQDSLERRVDALLDEIRDGDIDARERAETALSKLGPAALAPLRSRLAGADAEVRLRIESAVRKIERTEKLRARVSPAPTVTLAAGLPVRDAIREFNRQTGHSVVLRDVPPEATVAAAIDKAPCWSALDALCRAHGNLRWVASADGMVVGAGPVRDVPRVAKGDFLFFVDRIIVTRGAGDNSMTILPWLLWPAGRTPDATRLHVDALADDTGLDLRPESPPSDGEDALLGSLEEESRRIGRRFWYWSGKCPAAEATKLEKFTGTVTAEYVIEEVAGSLEKPGLNVRHPAPVAGLTVTVDSFRRLGEKVRVVLDVAGPQEPEIRQFALSGASKVRARARGHRSMSMPLAAGGRRATLECEFLFPADVEVASLDLLRDGEVERIEIPFDFSGLRLR